MIPKSLNITNSLLGSGKKYLKKNIPCRDFSSGPVVNTVFPMQDV